MYQYYLVNAKNHYLGLIQTETVSVQCYLFPLKSDTCTPSPISNPIPPPLHLSQSTLRSKTRPLMVLPHPGDWRSPPRLILSSSVGTHCLRSSSVVLMWLWRCRSWTLQFLPGQLWHSQSQATSETNVIVITELCSRLPYTCQLPKPDSGYWFDFICDHLRSIYGGDHFPSQCQRSWHCQPGWEHKRFPIHCHCLEP